MRVTIGTKATNPMPDGRMIPAIAITEEYSTPTEVFDKRLQRTVTINVTRADFISQRVDLQGVTYPHIGPEVVMYGRAAVAIPRFDYVEGLDVDADGNRISLDTLVKNYQTEHSAFLADGFQTRKAVIAADDL